LSLYLSDRNSKFTLISLYKANANHRAFGKPDALEQIKKFD
jgi:hypothetical protein